MIQEEKSTSMFDISRHLTRSKQWVSRLVLISFTLHLIRFSALPAWPLPVNSGKPHGATTYNCSTGRLIRGKVCRMSSRDRGLFDST